MNFKNWDQVTYYVRNHPILSILSEGGPFSHLFAKFVSVLR